MEGLIDGMRLGEMLGLSEGFIVGHNVGTEGLLVGFTVGNDVEGADVGLIEIDGLDVGLRVGSVVTGRMDGEEVGELVTYVNDRSNFT